MEEILASIRRIISEEDDDALERPTRPSAVNEARHQARQEPEPEPAPEPVYEPAPQLEPEREPEAMYEPEEETLQERYVEQRVERRVFELPRTTRPPEPSYTRQPVEETYEEEVEKTVYEPEGAEMERDDDGLLSQTAAGAASKAFGSLARNLGVNHEPAVAGGSQAIEGMVREMLQPLLKSWLDNHLPAIVEQLVQEEIERVARRGR